MLVQATDIAVAIARGHAVGLFVPPACGHKVGTMNGQVASILAHLIEADHGPGTALRVVGP